MTALSKTFQFTKNQSDLPDGCNVNFDDVVNYINNRNDGSASWDGGYFLSATLNPVLRVNNGAGTNDIARFQDNGTAVVTMPDGGGVTLAGTEPSPPVASTLYKANIVKGWVNFNGTGTIAARGSFNLTSLTDNGTGDYTITWNTDFANANYSVVGLSSGNPDNASGFLSAISSTMAVGSVNVISRDDGGVAVDSTMVNVIAIGAQ